MEDTFDHKEFIKKIGGEFIELSTSEKGWYIDNDKYHIIKEKINNIVEINEIMDMKYNKNKNIGELFI